jgi:O-antigen/teichoic acid export membrane protein
MRSESPWKLFLLQLSVSLILASGLLFSLALALREHVVEYLNDPWTLALAGFALGAIDVGTMGRQLRNGQKFWGTYSLSIAYALSGAMVVAAFATATPLLGAVLWFIMLMTPSTIAYLACVRRWKTQR